jgi:DNA-binding response OmpR family regulator
MIEIAIIEDDDLLREELNYMLSRHGFKVHETNSGKGLDDILSTTRIDMLLLDINLPGESGIVICKRIRAQLPSIGIVMLTAMPARNLRVDGYESGADLYMSKPVNSQELKQALLNLSKRLNVSSQQSAWQLDNKSLTMTDPLGNQIALTNNESRFLVSMIQSKENTISTENAFFLLDDADNSEVSKRALEAFVSRLRKKMLAHHPDLASPIKAAWGKGYKLTLAISLI